MNLDELAEFVTANTEGETLALFHMWIDRQRMIQKDLAMVPFDTDECDALRKEREKQYGNTRTNMATLAMAWTAILRQHYQMPDLPVMSSHVANWMQVTMKMLRACTPSPHNKDDYADAYNYLRFAEWDSVLEGLPILESLRQPGPGVGGGNWHQGAGE